MSAAFDFNDDPSAEEQHAEMAKNAKALSGRYSRLCWWVDRAEVEQSCWVAQLDAASRYDGSVPFGAWVWRAALHAASACVKKASAPVSASHRLAVLKGLMRASLIVTPDEGEEYERPEVSELNTDRPDRSAQRAQLRAKVRERVAALVGERGVDFAFATYNASDSEWTIAQIATAHSVSTAHVTRMRAQVRAALQHDDVLLELWKEL